MLLDRINSPFIRANATVLQALMRLIPFLAFGDQEKMHALVSHFMPYLDFDKYVFSYTGDTHSRVRGRIHRQCPKICLRTKVKMSLDNLMTCRK